VSGGFGRWWPTPLGITALIGKLFVFIVATALFVLS
jgi:hypothetical protein